MASVLLVSPLGASEKCGAILRSSHLLLNRNPNTRISNLGFGNLWVPHFRREISRIWCSNPTENLGETRPEKISERKEVPLFRSWNVPWDWKVTIFVMMPYLMSIVLTGIGESMEPTGAKHPDSENMLTQLHDELAIKMLMDQLLKSAAKLVVLYMFVSPHQPFPKDIFSLRWQQPLDRQTGWILWAGGGLLIASLTVIIVRAFLSSSGAGQIQNEAESLVRLLPLIGSSNVSTVCLLGILGVLAPVCEETIYRGFLMTSLTKWFPLPLSVLLSSAVFTLGHQSPGKSLEIFIFGVMLGLVYGQTRNLLAPITMHAWWNSGVIIWLTYLKSSLKVLFSSRWSHAAGREKGSSPLINVGSFLFSA